MTVFLACLVCCWIKRFCCFCGLRVSVFCSDFGWFSFLFASCIPGVCLGCLYINFRIWNSWLQKKTAPESDVVNKHFLMLWIYKLFRYIPLETSNLVISSRKKTIGTSTSRPSVCTKIKQLHFTRGFVYIAWSLFVVNLIQLFNNLRAFLRRIFPGEQHHL